MLVISEPTTREREREREREWEIEREYAQLVREKIYNLSFCWRFHYYHISITFIIFFLLKYKKICKNSVLATPLCCQHPNISRLSMQPLKEPQSLDKLTFVKRQNCDLGKNILLNRLTENNNLIFEDWLNLSLSSFKIKCSDLFLKD